jgi:predicted transcriptional regulator
VNWKSDEALGRISERSKDRIETMFDIESRAVSIGHIVHTLRIDFDTVKTILEVMSKHDVLEKIETNSQPMFRKGKK